MLSYASLTGIQRLTHLDVNLEKSPPKLEVKTRHSDFGYVKLQRVYRK